MDSRSQDFNEDILFLYWQCKWSAKEISQLYESVTLAQIEQLVRRKR